jgi:DNA ligase-1
VKELVKIFSDLANDSSRTGKENILVENQDNELFKEVLKFVYNPYIVTGISTKKLNKKISPIGMLIVPNTIKTVMNYLKENNSGRDKDILAIQKFIENLETEEERELARQIVTKDLKVGITEKTINKIYGEGFIPSFSVMLAESYEKKEAKVKGKFFITQKLDGNRCVAIKENGVTKFFSRKGQPVDGMVQLESEFQELPDNYVYDGELLLVNKDNLPSDELFRATQKVVRKDGEKKDLEFHVFDILPVAEFKKGKSKKTYEQRRNTLDIMFNHFNDGQIQHIMPLPVLYEGEDKNMVAVLMKWAEEQGYEGLMVNTANGLYQNKRVTDLLKVKKFKSADLLVMSVEKAIDGQFKGLLARVNVEYKGNIVGVGSGFTLEQRKQFIENPDLICGKIIEVSYFEESKDEKTGQPSLRFPVFKGIRDDKGVDDINYGE